jgi:hypothetical protein
MLFVSAVSISPPDKNSVKPQVAIKEYHANIRTSLMLSRVAGNFGGDVF